MKRFWVLLAVVAVVGLAVWSCGQSPEEKPKPAAQAKAPAPVVAPAPAGAPAPKTETAPGAAPAPQAPPATQAAPAPEVAPGPPGKAAPWGPMGPGLYDPKTVTTVKGTVESLGMAMGAGRRQRGAMSVNLKTDKGTLPVHLAPIWYLHIQKITVKPGVTMEVTGSQVSLEGKPHIVARQIKVDDTVIQLRDEQGLPLWAGGRLPPMPKNAGELPKPIPYKPGK